MSKSSNKVIAVDIDEVTADFISYFIYFHNLMYKTSIKRDEVSSYYLYKAFKVERKEMGMRFDEFQALKLLERLEPAKGAIAGIKKLVERGFAPNFVTARPLAIEKETRAWIKKYFKDIKIPLYFTHQKEGGKELKKSVICKEIGARILIDDHIENALDCAENGIKVFLMDAPWNQSEDLPENIIRVKSWKEIISLLNAKLS